MRMSILVGLLFAAVMIAMASLGGKFAAHLKAECPRELPTDDDAYRSYPRSPR